MFVVLFLFLKIYLNLRGHNESAEEQVPYGSQPAEGKCCFLRLSWVHLLINHSNFRFIQSSIQEFIFYSRLLCKEGIIFLKLILVTISSDSILIQIIHITVTRKAYGISFPSSSFYYSWDFVDKMLCFCHRSSSYFACFLKKCNCTLSVCL